MITILEPLCSTYLFGLSRFGISLIIVQSTFSFSSFYKKMNCWFLYKWEYMPAILCIFTCLKVHLYLYLYIMQTQSHFFMSMSAVLNRLYTLWKATNWRLPLSDKNKSFNFLIMVSGHKYWFLKMQFMLFCSMTSELQNLSHSWIDHSVCFLYLSLFQTL